MSAERPAAFVREPDGVVVPPGFVIVTTPPLPEGFVKGTGMFDVEVCDEGYPLEAKLQLVERNDRVIWRIVNRVADRAGVKAHVHALRAAFAVAYLETERDLVGLQEILGHTCALSGHPCNRGKGDS